MHFFKRFLKKSFLVSFIKHSFNDSRYNKSSESLTLNSLFSRNFSLDYDLKLQTSSYKYLQRLSSFFLLKKKRRIASTFVRDLVNFNFRINNKHNAYPRFDKSTPFNDFFSVLGSMRISSTLEPLSLMGSYLT
jgi:hypothetical protein